MTKQKSEINKIAIYSFLVIGILIGIIAGMAIQEILVIGAIKEIIPLFDQMDVDINLNETLLVEEAVKLIQTEPICIGSDAIVADCVKNINTQTSLTENCAGITC